MSKSSSVSGARSKRSKQEARPARNFPEEYLCYRREESSRARVVSRKIYNEGYKIEEIRKHSMSRSAHVGVLTRIYNEIHDLIVNEKGNVGDISEKYNAFCEAWYKYIDAHEKFFALLESESDKQQAVVGYEEQKERKLKLDEMVTGWRAVVDIARSTESQSESKSSGLRSKGCSVSTKLLVLSKKREEMALAQLKFEQLKLRQKFEEKE